MQTICPYDLVIGLDRSDAKADVQLIQTATCKRSSQSISTAPESPWGWLRELRQQ